MGRKALLRVRDCGLFDLHVTRMAVSTRQDPLRHRLAKEAAARRLSGGQSWQKQVTQIYSDMYVPGS